MTDEISTEFLSRKDTILAEVLNSIYDGVYITDVNRIILFWNRGAWEITGYSPDEVAGRSCSDSILNHIDENGNLLCTGNCPILQTINTGKEISAKVYPLNKSGVRFPVRTHISPIRDKNKNIIAVIEVFRDIRQEEEIRIIQEKFNKLIKQYVSSTTFDEVMEQARSGIEAKARLRDLTILYLDVVGFTEFTERNSAFESVKMLNDLFGLCEVIIRECLGDIDKFVGDAMLAVFIDANDAVNAGKRIVFDAIPALNRRRTEDGKEQIQVRIGINSGQLIQGDIGSIERKDLTVVGDVVNTAFRIQKVCEPGSLQISESTFSRLNDDNLVNFKFNKTIQLKGKNEPIKLLNFINPAEKCHKKEVITDVPIRRIP